MASPLRNARARNIALVLALFWTIVCVGGAWLLVRQSYTQTMQNRIAARAEQLAGELTRHIGALGITDPKEIEKLDLTDIFESTLRHEPRMSYAMFWGPTGRVMGHSIPAQLDKFLRPSDYQPLDRNESRRFMRRELVPFDPTARNVLEVTVPVFLGEAPLGYVSVAYPQSWLDEEFWVTHKSLLYAAAVVALVGVLLIFVALWLTERAIERFRQELETNARARTSLLTERGMLASVLAHEVRSPLTALRFNLHSLRNYVLKEAGTEKQLELADRCEREIRRLDLMLNDFLSRTQIIAPIMPTSVNRVVNEALDFLRPAFEQRNIRIVTHLDPADPLVAVNPDELRQVLLNLAANAQEAIAAHKGAPAGGSISVSTVLDRDATGTGGVTLLFRDSGVGIPEELHTRVFEPFFTTKPTGSGLGLALVRRVISGAGGTIFCESAMGEGTTFRIVLPQATAENVPVTQAPSEEAPEVVIDHTAADEVSPEPPPERE